MSLSVTQPSPYPAPRSDPYPAPPVPSWAPLRHVRPVAPQLLPALGQRVGDTERSLVCEQLSLHYSEGRLDPEELEERLSAAMSARTRADLLVLTRDLPATPAAGTAGSASPAPPSAARMAAVLVLLATSGICLLMILLSLVVSPGWAVGAVFGGSLAVVGGIAIGYLWNTRR